MSTKSRAYLIVFFSALFAIVMFAGTPRHALSQAQPVPMMGYLWSETVGWIDLNCANQNFCYTRNFCVSIASDGTLSGYAWSENIGWVSANTSDLSGCPSGSCVAKIQSNGSLMGWFKVLAADNQGWDGWISLSGTASDGTSYGPMATNGVFSGYAWGEANVGWLDFAYATTTYGTCTPSYSCSGSNIIYTNSSCQQSTYATCVAPAFCSPGSSSCLQPSPYFNLNGHLTANPKIVPVGLSSTVAWSVSNVSSCTVSGSNGDSWSDTPPSYTSTGSKRSSAINQQTIFTLSCRGLDGSSLNEKATVDIPPYFQEK